MIGDFLHDEDHCHGTRTMRVIIVWYCTVILLVRSPRRNWERIHCIIMQVTTTGRQTPCSNACGKLRIHRQSISSLPQMPLNAQRSWGFAAISWFLWDIVRRESMMRNSCASHISKQTRVQLYAMPSASMRVGLHYTKLGSIPRYDADSEPDASLLGHRCGQKMSIGFM